MLDLKGLEHGVGGGGAGGGRRRGFGAAMGGVPGGSVDGQRNLSFSAAMHALYSHYLLYFSVDVQRNLFLAPCVHFPYFTVFTEWVGYLGGTLECERTFLI